MTQSLKTPSALGGAMIISGTAIGAGMLALPIATAGMWYGWALIGMALSWFCMYQSGLCILEANLHYPLGANMDTIAKDCLSQPVRFINALSLVFVLYILTYAYITVGSLSLMDKLNGYHIAINAKYIALAIVIIFGGFVAFSTKAVDRVATIILVAMVLSFLLALPNLLQGVKVDLLLNVSQNAASYAPYTFYGIAVMVAAFGYHGNVSSLVKYYNKEARKVQLSLFYGTLIAAVIYTLWITIAQGHISRELFRTEVINVNGDQVSVIRHMLSSSVPKVFGIISMDDILTWFYNFAIISSFLGVTLGLFDWVADFFKLNDRVSGRMITAFITYVPPTLLALIFPFGFARAIGFAGLAATVWALIVPAMMMRATRKKYGQSAFSIKHGSIVFIMIVVFGVVVAASEIAKLFEVIPVYK